MNERMTDERREALRAHLNTQYLRRSEAEEVSADWDRARASEVEKGATIKALADALAMIHREGRKGDLGGAFVKPLLTKEEFAQVTAALRLCGRLP